MRGSSHLPSLEQLCINVANEQLQYFFNQHIFAWQARVGYHATCPCSVRCRAHPLHQDCRAEGISMEAVSFTNNEALLKLLLGTPIGLFSLLDEECNFPGATG